MRSLTRDPLLAVGRAAVLFAMVVTALVGGLLLVVAPFLIFGRADIMAKVSVEGVEGLTANTFVGIGGLLLLIAAMAACAFLFLRHLLRIIDSVDKGDPFAPINASRLAAMAWLALAIEALGWPAGMIGVWIARSVKDADIDVGFSLTGVLLAIVLFILARVFRKGAEMRAELEGTV
jgi:hypothetical protein